MTDTERERHISDCGRLMEAAMDRKTAATGRNPGTITGLSRKTHARDTETAYMRKSGVR